LDHLFQNFVLQPEFHAAGFVLAVPAKPIVGARKDSDRVESALQKFLGLLGVVFLISHGYLPFDKGSHVGLQGGGFGLGRVEHAKALLLLLGELGFDRRWWDFRGWPCRRLRERYREQCADRQESMGPSSGSHGALRN